MLEPRGLERLAVLDVDAVAVPLDSYVEGGNDLLGLVGNVLVLLQELVEADAAVELLLGGGVEVGPELGECCDLTVLGELKLHGTGDLLGSLELGSGTDAGHGESDGDGGALALVEELGLEEDLSVGDTNDVGGNVSGHISGLGLNDGEGGEGSSSEVPVHLGGALEEAGVEVEDISGVGLTSRRTTEEEGHLTVGDGLLGEIVVEDDGVLSVVPEPLSHGGSGVRGKELKGSGVGSGSSDNDAVRHGLLLVELTDELGDGRPAGRGAKRRVEGS